MATAKQPGGLYVVNGVVVDADGRAIPDPPAIEPDTVPASVDAAAAVPLAEQVAAGVAKALAAIGNPVTPAGDPAPVAPVTDPAADAAGEKTDTTKGKK
jgi:hypothetical protein